MTATFEPPPITNRIVDEQLPGMCDRSWIVWFRQLHKEQRNISSDLTIEGDLTVKGDLITHDHVKITAFGGSLGLEPATIEYYLNSTLKDTYTISYNSDNEINTITNSNGDTWTATYDNLNRLNDFTR